MHNDVTALQISEVKDSVQQEQDQLKELVAMIVSMNVQFQLLVSYFSLQPYLISFQTLHII
jgi:hypothetical protein